METFKCYNYCTVTCTGGHVAMTQPVDQDIYLSIKFLDNTKLFLQTT